jgi:hypothetical protein
VAHGTLYAHDDGVQPGSLMKMTRRSHLASTLGRLFLGAALLSNALAQDDPNLSPDANLFGDLAEQNGSVVVRRGGSANKAAVAKEGYGQTLVFKDGRELRGEVVEITKEQILWKRPDASEPLRFTRNDVRRIVTGTAGRPAQNLFTRFFAGRPNNGKQSAPPLAVTLKLPGGDWLFGKVTSTDGQTFTVQLGEKNQFAVPRDRIEWMQFNPAPAPAFGFSGSTLDMEGWLPANAAVELVDSALTVKGTPWLGRAITQPDRFEISFDLPADTEEGTRLWLQPFGPQPNCYGQGTTEIRFGRKEISRLLFIDKFERTKTPLPKEDLDDKGPGKYRVFFSEAEKRVIVLRNGHQIGDWKYSSEKDAAGNVAVVRDFRFNGICFDREDQGQGGKPLKFSRLRMLPWNGVLPKEGEPVDSQDQLTEIKGAPLPGKLEAMAEKEITFSGAPHTVKAGDFIQFPLHPDAAFADAEAKLDFGQQGEFSVRHLEARDGKLFCESSFAGSLELPFSALERLTFPAQSAPATATTDAIVFKNGDELPGKVISAGLPGPVRWRTSNGQEVEFDPGRIAGLRISGSAATTEPPKAEATAAMVELRSGERLSGKVLAFNEKQLQLEHTRLGSLTLDRSQLWHLFPNPRLRASDGVLASGGWKWTDPAAKAEGRPKKTMETAHWVHLDGTYFVRNEGNVTFFDASTMPGLEHAITSDMERFEVRVETTGLSGSAGNFLMTLLGKNTTSLNATLSYSELQAVVIDPHGRQPNWKEIPLQEKLGNNSSHRALRLFVDTKAGTCDFVINGVHIVRLGHDKIERLLKGQYTVRVVPYPNQVSLLSNIWVGPWNGELPRVETEAAGATALANGDVAPGIPKCILDGKLVIDSELGELNLPLDKTLALDFGGAMDPKRTPARLRLEDGTTLNVETFHWDGNELTAHSLTLGDFRLPADIVQEIVYDPALPRAPMAVMPRALAQKSAEDNTRVFPDK